jgi:hypothetical protein
LSPARKQRSGSQEKSDSAVSGRQLLLIFITLVTCSIALVVVFNLGGNERAPEPSSEIADRQESATVEGDISDDTGENGRRTDFGTRANTAPPTATDAEQRIDRPIVVHKQGYVGSQSCRQCHADQYDSWHASYHRKMTQVATPEAVIGDFDDFETTIHGHAMRLTREGDQYFYEGPNLEWAGPQHEMPRVKRQIVQTTGSHHMQIYWYTTGKGRVLASLPLVWLNEESQWVPRPAIFLRRQPLRLSSQPGRWNRQCLRCHATNPQVGLQLVGLAAPTREQSENAQTHVSEFGISCEACHGPAEQHVEWHIRKHQIREADQHKDLVVPSQLSAQRSSEVCGQCHGILDFNGMEAFAHWARHGFKFRPGDQLDNDIRTVVRFDPKDQAAEIDFTNIPKSGLMWSDGMVRVSGREYNGLINSPCFKHDDESNRMTCLSCHSMHEPTDDLAELANWADDQLAPGMRTNQACTQCHVEYRNEDILLSHTHHQAGSSGSQCYNCHMPHTTYGLLKAMRSHTIDSPTVQASLATGRPNACNACHLDKTLAWSAKYLNQWYGIEEPQLDKDQQTIAASALWALKGDAGQRALMAWSMGWPDAREVSETDWMTPYIAQLMVDDYEAVRLIATRTMHKQTGFEDLKYNPSAPPQQCFEIILRIAKNGYVARPGDKILTTGPNLLIGADGKILEEEFKGLLNARDQTEVRLFE